jgi:phenylacetate-coenzyme A ligase PaaK-like adenylate-forming protein
MLPRDIWPVKGIICSGLDSWVYRDKIKELWGRYPLDVYATTEGGVIATQTWDYDSMTFVPNLNFLEFIPEEEHIKLQMDSSYRPQTLLLNEVEAGKNYEIIITNFHAGSLVRYRIGDLIKITSLNNEKLGIDIPQMLFERRIDGIINFVVVQLTEKLIWQAIEHAGIAYEDWTSYKKPGESVLTVLIEPKNSFQGNIVDVATEIRKYIFRSDDNNHRVSGALEDLTDMFDFRVEVELLHQGAFANYTAHRQAEGADLAHLKPPHVNPSDKVLSLLLKETEEIEVVKTRTIARARKISV